VRRVGSLGYAGVGADKGKITKKDIQDPLYSRHVQMGWNYRMPELCAAVALAQLENIDELVNRRIEVANLFSETVKNIDWLKPQYVGSEYKNSYWTWVVKLDNPKLSWYDFRDKFLEYGGDGIYAAWKLTYLEPMFQNMNLLKRENYISDKNKQMYKAGLCPNAEKIHDRLLQFKTNYWNFDDALKQAEILKQTVKYFNQ
jgi:perosamine synthetase